MPMGNPNAYGGPMMGQGRVGNGMNVAVLQALAEERKAREEQGILTLLGGLALAGAMQGEKGKKGEGKAKGKGTPSAKGKAPSGAAQTGMSASLGGGRSGRGGQAPGGGAQSKMDPFTIAAVGSGMAAGAGGTAAAGTAAAAGGSLLSSPVLGAGVAGAATLADGLMGGGEGDELQKKALKTNRQESLFGSVAALTDSLRRRNEEMRAAFARA